MTQTTQYLYTFFLQHFDTADLRRFFALHYQDLAGHLPDEKISGKDLAMRAVSVLHKNGAIDETLFILLQRDRPRLTASIEQMRTQLSQDTDLQKAEPGSGGIGWPPAGPARDRPKILPLASSPASEPRAGRSKALRVACIAANPTTFPALELAAEAGRIKDKLRGTPAEERIRFEWIWRATPEDLLDAFFPTAPDILHFAGHGTPNGALLLETADGAAHPVVPSAFARLLAARPSRPRVVVLNACYSAVMAKALVMCVDVVVGMRSDVADVSAREFAVQLYRALAHGDAMAAAFDTAQAALGIHNPLAEDLPQLSVRPGVDTRTLHLL